MPRKVSNIPVNVMDDYSDGGIAIERIHFSNSEAAALNGLDDAKQSHREDRHSFFLLESGKVVVEIDFHKFEIKASTVIYMHSDKELTISPLVTS